MFSGETAKSEKNRKKDFNFEFPSFYSEKSINLRFDGDEVVVTTISGKKISFIPINDPARNGQWDKFITASKAYEGDLSSFYNRYIDGDKLWFLNIVPDLLVDNPSFENKESELSSRVQFESGSLHMSEMDENLKIGNKYGEEGILALTVLVKCALFEKYFGKLTPDQVKLLAQVLVKYKNT